jgi:hypothetical protein
LYERVRTPFSVSSTVENFDQQFYMGLCEPFLYDHCNVQFGGELTEAKFGKYARNFVLNNSFLTFLHFELNNRLLDFILTNITKNLSIPFSLNDLEKMFSLLIRELSAIQIGQNTSISQEYDFWPLQHPSIVNDLEEVRYFYFLLLHCVFLCGTSSLFVFFESTQTNSSSYTTTDVN